MVGRLLAILQKQPDKGLLRPRRPGRPRRFAPPKRAPPNLHLHFDLDVLDVGADVPCPRH